MGICQSIHWEHMLPGGTRICAFSRFPHWFFFQTSQNLPWKMLRSQVSEGAPLWISKLPCLVDQSLYLSLKTRNSLSSSPSTLSDWGPFSLHVHPSMLPMNRTARGGGSHRDLFIKESWLSVHLFGTLQLPPITLCMLKLKVQYFGHLIRTANSSEKTLFSGKDWRQEEKRVEEDEMVGWYH